MNKLLLSSVFEMGKEIECENISKQGGFQRGVMPEGTQLVKEK